MDRERINKKFGVTDAQLDQEAKEYEDGAWAAPLGKLLKGRPSLADEEVKPITVRLPISQVLALDEKASTQGGTRSEILRKAIAEYLTA